jgi:hypothetical protein
MNVTNISEVQSFIIVTGFRDYFILYHEILEFQLVLK